jgi:hypothetical protein
MRPLKNIHAIRMKLFRRVAISASCVLIALVALAYLINIRSQRVHSTGVDVDTQSRLEEKSHVSATIDDRSDIMAQFVCNCGSCRVIDDLRDCNCSHLGGAREVKRFIDERIQEGRYSATGIVELVASRYGGRKAVGPHR